MPGESVPQGMWLPPRTATLFVAANNALDRSRAQCDYLCDGVADDVQINQALNALPAGGGRVMLSEGTFNIVNPITIPRSNIILRGQGRSTFINGDGLATGEHGIVISGVANCTIKKLAIQTQDGGGKVCHCIFIGNWADSFEIEYVTIVDSDSDGIHIGGTDITDGGSIHNCHINDADGYGIMVSMNNGNQMLRLHVFDNFILSAGNAGIALWSGAGVGNTAYCNISGNVVYANGNEGIIVWDSGCTVISGNIVVENTQWGIRVRESAYVNLSNNVCYLNGADGILFEDSTECLAEGNVCIWSTAATSDGIQVEGINNSIIGNHCWGNGRHGINILAGGSQANLTGNFCFENDYHGINVAAAEVKVSGNYCHHNSQAGAGTYHGINLTGDAHRCQVNNNFCNDDGASQEDGIHLTDGACYVQIVGNYCYCGMGSGIALMANNDYCLLKDNYCLENDDYGIEIVAATCNGNIVENNQLQGNVTGQILDGGTDTVLPFIFVAVPNPSGNIGTHPAEQLTDGIAVLSRFEVYIPANFVELVRAQIIIVPLANGDLVGEVATNFGKVCAGEAYNVHTDAIAEAVLDTVVQNDIECIDIAPAFTGLAAHDLVGVEFTRHGENALDTIGANVWLLGLRLQYV